MKAIRLLLVDDQRAVRRGLRMRLELEPDLQVVGEAENGVAAVETVRALRPDVVVMDYEMPGLNGVDAVRALRAQGSEAGFVMLSIHDDAATVREALEAGATAFVPKHRGGDALLSAVRSAAVSRAPEV
jgi:DNA-binding NarL/FixJ family response regulator